MSKIVELQLANVSVQEIRRVRVLCVMAEALYMQWLGTLGQVTLAKDRGIWQSICPWGVQNLSYYGTNYSVPFKQMIHQPSTEAKALTPETMKARKAEVSHDKWVEVNKKWTEEDRELSRARRRVSYDRHRTRKLERRGENKQRREKGLSPLTRTIAVSQGPATIEELVAVGYVPSANYHGQKTVQEKVEMYARGRKGNTREQEWYARELKRHERRRNWFARGL
ncbi:hypothetical protein MMC17_004036 [Xylographa soralifera]|nr:hypothetical protein [Xylographa soralifera]